MRTTRSSSHRGGGWGSPPGHCYGLLVWWPCYGLLPPPRPYQKATFNQKTTKPEGHNRRPHAPRSRPPRDQAPPPPQTCCKACWDITCNACWDSIPPWTESQTPVKTLPCPNFVAGGNKAVHRWLKTYASNQLLRRPLSSIWPRHHTQCRGRHAEYRRRSSVLCRTEFLKNSKHMRWNM